MENLTAAIPMENPYCSCKLTRVRAVGEAVDVVVPDGIGPGEDLAVGETVILLALPLNPLLKRLLKGEEGAAERQNSRRWRRLGEDFAVTHRFGVAVTPAEQLGMGVEEWLVLVGATQTEAVSVVWAWGQAVPSLRRCCAVLL